MWCVFMPVCVRCATYVSRCMGKPTHVRRCVGKAEAGVECHFQLLFTFTFSEARSLTEPGAC